MIAHVTSLEANFCQKLVNCDFHNAHKVSLDLGIPCSHSNGIAFEIFGGGQRVSGSPVRS